jgi:hypothetical protein
VFRELPLQLQWIGAITPGARQMQSCRINAQQLRRCHTQSLTLPHQRNQSDHVWPLRHCAFARDYVEYETIV